MDERNTVKTPFFRLSDQCLYCKLTRSNVILTMMTAGGLGRSRRCLNSIIMVFGVWMWAFCCLGNGGRFESAPVCPGKLALSPLFPQTDFMGFVGLMMHDACRSSSYLLGFPPPSVTPFVKTTKFVREWFR